MEVTTDSASLNVITDCAHNSSSISCYICKKVFPSKNDVISHLKLIHNACATPKCNNVSDPNMHSLGCKYRGFVCSICQKHFTDNSQLLVHFNQHINAAFHICEICRSGFQQWDELQIHFRDDHHQELSIPANPHNNTNVYQKCSSCCKYYQLFSEYEEHVSSCAPSYQCSICNLTFNNSSSLESHEHVDHGLAPVKGHQALIDGKRYFCGVCYIGFHLISILNEHMKVHTEGKFMCDVCQSSFMSDNELQTHYLEHIEEHYVMHEVIQLHSCSSCKQTFKTRTDLENHLLQNSYCHANNKDDNLQITNKKCTIVDSKDKNPLNTFIEDGEMKLDNFQEHVEDLDKEISKNESYVVMISCEIPDVCIYSMKNGGEITNCDDGNCIIVIDQKSMYVFQRGICCSEKRIPVVENAVPFNMSDPIDTTLLPNHMLNILNYEDLSVSSSIENLLPEVSLSINDDLLSTIEDVSAVDNVVYSVIDSNNDSKDIDSESTLSAEPENDYEEYGFAEDSMFDTVEMTVSTSTPIKNNSANDGNPVVSRASDVLQVSAPHVCNICKQVFGSKTSLCLHVKGSHTGFDCYRCGESFSNIEELLSHEQVVHKSAFECEFCCKSFSKEFLLTRHRVTAHGSKFYLCPICKTEFFSKNEFEVHIINHKEFSENLHSTASKKCNDCGKVFTSMTQYLRHRTTQHEDKKFMCTICDKRFVTQLPLRKHLVTHMRKTPMNSECPLCKVYFSSNMIQKHVKSHEIDLK